MIRALELFIAITSLIIGASHLFRPKDWADAFQQLHRLGHAGAFINGAIHLTFGAMIVAALRSWTWPETPLMVLGVLLVAKGTVCLLAPGLALRSIAQGAKAPTGFIVAGFIMLAISGWACYCLWKGAANR